MITLAKFKRFLAILDSNTTKDVELQEFIDDAIGEADRIANRKLEYGSHVVYVEGNCKNYMFLNQGPVHAISEIKVWDGEDYTDDLFTDSDTVANSIIYPGGFKVQLLKGYTFSGSLKITFTAGYRYADKWAASKAYLVGNLVLYNGTLYECATAHTSATTFAVGSNWTELNVETPPADLEKAVKFNAAVIFYESPVGEGWFMKNSSNTGGQSQDGFTIGKDKMVEYYTKTYEAFRIPNF